MEGSLNIIKTLEQVIKSRRSTRNFTSQFPKIDDLNKIIESAIYAPYGGATGIALEEIRKFFIFQQNTEEIKKARELLISEIRKKSKKLNIVLALLPFLKKRMKTFAKRLEFIAENGINSLNNASYYIIIAEKKGFPPIEKESMAHAIQNMWLTATDLNLGFQIISATGVMSKNKKFLKLLNLTKGEYEINGCVIGYPETTPEKIKVVDLDSFTVWV